MSLFGGRPSNTSEEFTTGLSSVVPDLRYDEYEEERGTQVSSSSHSDVTDNDKHENNHNGINKKVEQASEESEESEDSEDEHVTSRPNKFVGSATAWRSYTVKDREVVASLKQLEADDLAIHLYNAHAWKRSLYKKDANTKPASLWVNKRKWVDNHISPSGNTENWTPDEKWTAWPLQSHRVPRAKDRFGARDDGFDTWTVKRRKIEKPSDELDDLMIGLIAKMAKERLISSKISGDSMIQFHEEHRSRSGSRSRSRSLSVRSMNTGLATESGQYSESDTSSLRSVSPASQLSVETTSTKEDSNRSDPVTDHPEGGMNDIFGTASSGSEEDTTLTPTILADDYREREILQSTVRSILGDLDLLLEGLQQSRNYQIRDAASPTETDSSSSISEGSPTRKIQSKLRNPWNDIGNTSGEGRVAPGTARGRPPKPYIQENSESGTDLDMEESGKKVKHGVNRGGRPTIYGKPRPGESYYMMRKRLARTYHDQSGELLDSPNGNSRSMLSKHSSTTSEDESSSSSLTMDTDDYESTSKEVIKDRDPANTIRLNPRDWSEVVGMAAMRGWNAKVVQRAAKRCCLLFGERMSFRTFHEDLPTTSTALGSDIPELEQSSHAKAPMFGGVHLDGFLQTIRRQHGWRGKDEHKSDKRKQEARRRRRHREQS
ncbi:hypothetical protein M501DRAFT_1020894 [Patellaria atrata CBS 101060]|uniref:Rrn9 domain-containing protein n=1 Tax=Patellaria atrata CBS 101060 TaxID=1346257 RepID=A0A9P4S1A8_9PEZI|nr:hypothetical protein M501DRAFT_1020894 [Patellaria atrata CBS 101060]